MELEKVSVTILNEADCVAVTGNGAVIRTPDGSELELKADSVIWAGGYLPMDDEASSSARSLTTSGRSATARRSGKYSTQDARAITQAQIFKRIKRAVKIFFTAFFLI